MSEPRGRGPEQPEGDDTMRTRSASRIKRNTWQRRLHRVQACAMLLCVGLLRCGNATGETVTLDFDTTAVGSLPAVFSTALTGRGAPGAWRILEDPTAPSGGKVLAQTSTDKTSSRFPLCVYNPLTATDVSVSVRFKAVAGTVDQAAGLVARFTDQDNYYIVRANALENNVRLYKVARGDRKQFAGRDVGRASAFGPVATPHPGRPGGPLPGLPERRARV
jgi:hypothetical protein